MKKSILGVEITDAPLSKCIEIINDEIKSSKQTPFHIITANPEIVMQINRDKEFKDIEEKSGMITADGIGVIWGSAILQNKIKNKVIGVDLLSSLLELCEKESFSVYLLGASEETSCTMMNYTKENFPNLKIAGRRNGFFDTNADDAIVKEIRESNTDLLIMGMGSPRAHKWFNSRRNELNIKATIDIGGAFDSVTGIVPRAPAIILKLNLEWLYRRFQNPERSKRQKDLYRFVGEVFKERFRKTKKYK